MFQHSKLAFKLIFLFLVFSAATFANEAPTTPPADGALESKVSFEDKQQQERTKEWMDVVANLNALKTKIRAKEDTIKEIIHHKNMVKNSAAAGGLVEDLLREHKELTKLLEEYNKGAQVLKYRYPDVGITERRKYEKLELRTLSEFEEAQTLGGKLKKTVSKLKTHYGVKEKKSEIEKINKPNFDNNYLAQPKILKK